MSAARMEHGSGGRPSASVLGVPACGLGRLRAWLLPGGAGAVPRRGPPEYPGRRGLLRDGDSGHASAAAENEAAPMERAELCKIGAAVDGWFAAGGGVGNGSSGRKPDARRPDGLEPGAGSAHHRRHRFLQRVPGGVVAGRLPGGAGSAAAARGGSECVARGAGSA